MSKLNSYFQLFLFRNRKVKYILALDFILEKLCFKRDETCFFKNESAHELVWFYHFLCNVHGLWF